MILSTINPDNSLQYSVWWCNFTDSIPWPADVSFTQRAMTRGIELSKWGAVVRNFKEIEFETEEDATLFLLRWA